MYVLPCLRYHVSPVSGGHIRPLWLLFFFSYLKLPISECDCSLLKVIVLFRHGARTPLIAYKFLDVPNNNENFWPEGYGRLTQSGKKQLFQLGQTLRERYRDFLVPHNDSIHTDVQTVTTESERCYQSAGFLLAGLYPASTGQKWSEELNWSPVPITYNSPDRIKVAVSVRLFGSVKNDCMSDSSLKIQKIIGDRRLCPTYYEDLQAMKIRANLSDPNIPELLNFFSRYVTSAGINDLTDLYFLVDYFHSEKTSAEWIPKAIRVKMNRFYANSFNYLTSTFRMRRLLVGTLIKDIILRIDEAVYRRKSNSKFFLYSGHDSSLHSLGRTIGFQFESAPYFGASIIFEVHQLSMNDFRIKLLYSPDYSLQKLGIWVLPGCEVLCPVKKFIELTEKYTPHDWTAECHTILNKL